MNEGIRHILNSVSRDERQVLDTLVLGPSKPGGSIRTRMSGLVYTFRPRPADFEGWGLFSPVSHLEAELVQDLAEADWSGSRHIRRYLDLLSPVRVRLARQVEGQTWVAYPVNRAEATSRAELDSAAYVHLVGDGARFDQVIARWDGASLWFDEADRRAGPVPARRLNEHFERGTSTKDIRFTGLTPEMQDAYAIAIGGDPIDEGNLATAIRLRRLTPETREAYRRSTRKLRPAPPPRELTDEERLENALNLSGGRLRSARDRGAFWTIEWGTSTGSAHYSGIDKRDLTVISAGICLSGRDRDFDLQSLVGVMEGRGASW